MTFLEFLYKAGMFTERKQLSSYSEHEIKEAKSRYYDAISTCIKGTGMVLLKREVKDIFTNGYNKNMMKLHHANHDIQIVLVSASINSRTIRLTSI